jgi:putative transposase
VIASGHPEDFVDRRFELLDVPRASYYCGPASGLRQGDLELMRRIDELYLQHPWMGSRSLADQLTAPEAPMGRDQVRRLMLIVWIESLAPKPGTSRRQPKHPVYPYLLRGMAIDKPNQVWATDITHIPMTRGFMYLIAIMDWATRKFKDNIFIVRLWRPLKYERIYLKAYETGAVLSRDLTVWFNWYN